MNTGQIAKSAFRGIMRNKLRSGLMMIGVMVGVGALTVVTALGESTVKGVMDKIESTFSANNIFLSAGGGNRHGAARGEGPTTTLTLDDMEAIAAEVPNVDLYAPSARVGNRMVSYRGKNKEVRISGHSEAAESLYRRAERGAFLNANDIQSAARVAIIGQDAAQELFGDADPIGEQMRIASVPFQIVGVLEKGGIDIHGINRDMEIFVPVTTAMRRLENVDHITAAKIHVQDASLMAETVAAIQRVLRVRHQLSAEQADDFSMITPVQVHAMVEENNRTMTLFLPLIAAIAIIVGAMINASLMLVSVNERRPEIGLRKAVGARSRDIQAQFLIESTAMTTLAGILGLALGAGISQVVLNMQGKPLALPIVAMMIGLVTAVAVGFLAGVIPARRAAALDPVETLR